jgi:multiple sugar transport system substrate-binding protein
MTEPEQFSWSISRRQFLKTAAAGAVSTLAMPYGHAAASSLTILHESSFIKTFDTYFQQKLAPAYEKMTGVKINYELASVGTLQTRVTTVAETGKGADIALNFFNWPFLYDEKYLDVSDIAEAVGKQQGGWYDSAKEACVVNGRWKAVPFGNVGQLMNWRIDWFKEVGFDKFPDTWDELLEAGTKLKAKGHPFGFELGHGFGDNHGWIYPLMWSYGAHEVEPDGKTIVLDSDETARAIDFARKFFKQTMLEDVLGWLDPSNNKAYFSQQISCTNNAESILWLAKRDFPDLAKVTGQSMNPRGPKGRFHLLLAWSHSILTHTPDRAAAKAFLRWLMDKPQLEAWYAAAATYYQPFLRGYDNSPMWDLEPRNHPYRDALASAHLPGWPAPVSRAQSEVIAKYVVIDMFAKACAGASTKEVIKEAVAQLKQIYRQA